MSEKPVLFIVRNTNRVKEIMVWKQLAVTFPQAVLPKPVTVEIILTKQKQ